jgi:ligand-binding sensor domain-containing protein
MKTRLFILLVFVTICNLCFAQYPGWKTYYQTNSQIPFKNIWTIAFDKDGNTWFGTNSTNSNGHLCKFNGQTFQSQSYGAWIYDIKTDKNGVLWVINSNYELKTWDGNQWNTYQNDDLEWYSEPLLIDNNGVAWMNPMQDLLKFDGSNWTKYTVQNSGLVSGRIVSILNHESKLAIMTSDSGFQHFDGTTWTTYIEQDSYLPSNHILDAAVDKGDTLWLLLKEGYLAGFRNGTWKVFQSPSFESTWGKIAIDNKDFIWVVCGGSPKLIKFDKHNNIEYQFDTTNSLLPKYGTIQDLKIDSKNRIWLASHDGLITYSGDTGSTSNIKPNTINVPELLIFPNPSNDFIKINSRAFQNAMVEVSIFNSLGEQVIMEKAKFNSSGNYTLNLKQYNIPDGYYLVKTTSGNFMKSSKILIQSF